MKKSISTDQTPDNIANILEILTYTPIGLKILGESIKGKKRQKPLGEGERSLTEALAHLLNSEARTSEAIYLALLLDEPHMQEVHSEREWGKLMRFDLLDFEDLLVYFNLRRKVLLRTLSALSEAQWSRSVQERGKKRKESIYWKARSLAMHEAEHIQDLENKSSKLK